MASSTKSSTCAHKTLAFEPSAHANEAGYRRPSAQQRATAAGLKKGEGIDETAFPGPLVLPNDDLAWDPKWPAQSLRSWIREKDRNEVTPERKTIYVAAPPKIDKDVAFMNDWSVPLANGRLSNGGEKNVLYPRAEDVVDYLAAFYHGLPVKMLSSSQVPLRLLNWDEESGDKKKAKKKLIALATAAEAIYIRSRPCPDSAFLHQLNLNDLLDVVISVLPSDAYSLLLLVNQDIYEDEDDDYCCGRAYGGSRCAVVSMARYNPILQDSSMSDYDHIHPWPASHCADYVGFKVAERQGSVDEEGADRKIAKSRKSPAASVAGPAEVIDLTSSSPPFTNSEENGSPLHQALQACTNAHNATASSLWLSHICRTASHELGHCLGIDHCVYYACVMQGTASMAEDRRQPPYLCPVDLEKIKMAVCAKTGAADEWTKERYQALLNYCDGHTQKGEGGLWAGFAGWLQGRLGQIDSNTEPE